MRIAVFATSELLRAGLEEVLTDTTGVTDVITAGTLAELIESCEATEPDVAVLELDGTENSTSDALAELRQLLPAVRLIGMCTGRRSEPKVGELLANGLDDVASIRHGVATLRHQLRLDGNRKEMVGHGPSLHGSVEDAPIAEPSAAPALTPREVDVLAHVSAGLTAAEIANRLGVTHKTIENHKQRIYTKLDVHNQTQAVSVAFRRGLLNGSNASVGRSRRAGGVT